MADSETEVEQIVVSDPEPFDGGVTDGLGVDYDEFHECLTISNFSDGKAHSTVYVDQDEVPDLVRALTEMVVDE